MKMCEHMMANIQIIEATRKAFMSTKAFDVHPTKKHSEQDPFPDHIKGMWFCLREEVVSCVEGRNVIRHFPLDGLGPKEIQLPSLDLGLLVLFIFFNIQRFLHEKTGTR